MDRPTLGDLRGPATNVERTPPTTPPTEATTPTAPSPDAPPAAKAPAPADPVTPPANPALSTEERVALADVIGTLQAVLDGPVEDTGRAVFGAFDKLAGAFALKTTAAERYRRRLKLAGIAETEAMAIVDAVLTQGYYEEYVYIRTKRATLRTRLYEDSLRLQTALEDNAHLQLRISQDELVTRHNLAGSLVEWAGVAVPRGGTPVETEQRFKDALLAIPRMAGPVVQLLVEKLGRFDHKVSLVFSEGCTDIFGDPVG